MSRLKIITHCSVTDLFLFHLTSSVKNILLFILPSAIYSSCPFPQEAVPRFRLSASNFGPLGPKTVSWLRQCWLGHYFVSMTH